MVWGKGYSGVGGGGVGMTGVTGKRILLIIPCETLSMLLSTLLCPPPSFPV